jgi:hypothetical protein
MAAARTSESSVDIQLRTRQYIPEDSELQKCLRCYNFTLYSVNIGTSAIYLVYSIIIIVVVVVVVVTWPCATK